MMRGLLVFAALVGGCDLGAGAVGATWDGGAADAAAGKALATAGAAEDAPAETLTPPDAAAVDAWDTGPPPVPCLHVEPDAVDFGATPGWEDKAQTVRIASCGGGPLVVTGMRMLEGSSPAFSVQPAEACAPGDDDCALFDALPAEDAPWIARGRPEHGFPGPLRPWRGRVRGQRPGTGLCGY
jgi:hypothetical protein